MLLKIGPHQSVIRLGRVHFPCQQPRGQGRHIGFVRLLFNRSLKPPMRISRAGAAQLASSNKVNYSGGLRLPHRLFNYYSPFRCPPLACQLYFGHPYVKWLATSALLRAQGCRLALHHPLKEKVSA